MSNSSYYLRLSGLLQRLMQLSRTQAHHYSLSQGLSLSECRVLFLLRSGKPVEMNEVKNSLFVTGAFATSIADRLVRHKLVVRQRDDKDRRKVTMMLTDKGKHCLVRLKAHRKSLLEALLSDLTEKDKEIMEKGLLILVASLESTKRV